MYIADLHIHSSYSRATAKNVTPEVLELWGRKKGIDLIGTGDFTHPAWRKELSERLEPLGDGLYRLKEEYSLERGKYSMDCGAGGKAHESVPGSCFVITGEISSIYKQDGRVRKVHSLIILPSLEDAERLSAKLETIGNIHSDGRPILGLSCHDLLEITLELCPRAIYVPAHIWTPHFSMFGAFSGFDSVEECFGDLSEEIHAVETGLSSDPLMNRRVSMLDKYQLISNSDAHSPSKLGREATLFSGEFSYEGLYRGIETGEGLYGTIEFYPEEGKYHLDGHRNCHLCLTPSETEKYNGICPICGKKITVGVLHRVEELADKDRSESYRSPSAKPFESLMPLNELIGASWGRSPESAKVKECYEEMLRKLGSEFYILREAPISDIRSAAGGSVAEGIRKLREGKVRLKPGFDGEYGRVELFSEDEMQNAEGQMSFFASESAVGPGKGPGRAVSGSESDKEERDGSLKLEELGQKGKGKREADRGLNLNERQLLAVRSTSKVTAVSAGPGTGKTRTLTEAIVYRIEERGVRPSEICALTFTNKAAGELKERLCARLKGKARYIKIGTIHSLCLELLKSAGIKEDIADEFITKDYVEEAIERFGLEINERAFLREVSLIKNKCGSYEKVSPEAFSYYTEKLREAGLMDFDDILLRACELLSSREGRRLKGKGFSYIFADELQDTGEVEYEAIKALFDGGKELFVIGDRDQSIYGFRGARADCFEKISSDFPAARLIRLDTNYRSKREIVEASCRLISNNPGGKRELNSGLEPDNEKLPQNKDASDLGAPESPVRVVRAESELSQAIFTAREINRLVGGIDMIDRDMRGELKGKTRSFSDIAIVYRNNYQAKLLERALRKEGIPYIVSGREDFLLSDSVRAAVLFFRYLIYNDERAGETSLKILSGFKRDSLSELILEGMRDRFPKDIKDAKPSEILGAFSGETGLSEDENMGKLIKTALFYSDMESFITNISMGKESDVYRVGGKSYSSDAVRLSTVHGAKGLEFPVVFIFGAEEGKFPARPSAASGDENAEPEEKDPSDRDLEEERRIFFVAMTRAKELLYINTVSGKESEFISELPGELCHEEEARAYTKSDREKRSAREQGVQMSIFDFI